MSIVICIFHGHECVFSVTDTMPSPIYSYMYTARYHSLTADPLRGCGQREAWSPQLSSKTSHFATQQDLTCRCHAHLPRPPLTYFVIIRYIFSVWSIVSGDERSEPTNSSRADCGSCRGNRLWQVDHRSPAHQTLRRVRGPGT